MLFVGLKCGLLVYHKNSEYERIPIPIRRSMELMKRRKDDIADILLLKQGSALTEKRSQ
jgi:hypothetical protein